MPSKYDTNPLDPDFPEKAKAAAAGQETRALPYSGPTANGFAAAAGAEEPTRRFGSADYSAYGQAYNGQNVPGAYQPGAFMGADRSHTRKVDKVGLPENIMVALPYLPFSIGLIAGVLELLFVSKHEAKVRFHAAQGLAAHVGILIVTTILGVIGEFARTADIGNGIFTAVTTIMLLVFAFKAWRGKPIHLESVEPLTNWLEEKIKLKN
jgi:uncharacterized membrane protein